MVVDSRTINFTYGSARRRCFPAGSLDKAKLLAEISHDNSVFYFKCTMRSLDLITSTQACIEITYRAQPCSIMLATGLDELAYVEKAGTQQNSIVLT